MEEQTRQIWRVLRFARALIADKDNWATGWMAYNMAGEQTPPESVTACRFCALGAVYRAAKELKHKELRSEALNLLSFEAKRLFAMRLDQMNDVMGHKAVMKVFDAAIERLANPEDVLPPKPGGKPKPARRKVRHATARVSPLRG